MAKGVGVYRTRLNASQAWNGSWCMCNDGIREGQIPACIEGLRVRLHCGVLRDGVWVSLYVNVKIPFDP